MRIIGVYAREEFKLCSHGSISTYMAGLVKVKSILGQVMTNV